MVVDVYYLRRSATMEESVSSGAIVYRETNDERQYLVLKSRANDWEFPKGGIEGSEELQQTAIREVKEETGINELRLIDGFREDYDYIFRAPNGDTIHKEVHLFIAEALDDNVRLSKEHSDLQWRNYEEALNTLTHDGPKEALKKAKRHLG